MTERLGPRLFINGKPAESNLVPLPFEQEELSVFESLRSYGGIIFRLGQHLDRLFESAKSAGLDVSKSREELRKEVYLALRYSGRKDAFLRLWLDSHDRYILVLERNRPAWIYEKGVALKTAATRRNLINAAPPEVKAGEFLNNILAFLEQEDPETFESIFLDADGFVTEALVWNLFTVKRGKIFTAGSGVLNGVTRRFVIECAEKERLPVFELNLTRHDLWNAEEAFLTNTSGEIVPIASVDGRKIGGHIPGLITRRLTERFRKELRKELRQG